MIFDFETSDLLAKESFMWVFLAEIQAQRPWRWRFLSEITEFAAEVAEWVLNLEMPATMPWKDFLNDSL